MPHSFTVSGRESDSLTEIHPLNALHIFDHLPHAYYLSESSADILRV